MNNLLYTYEEVCDLINERELKQFERKDAADRFMWQFAKNASVLMVKTIMESRYVLCANEKDYNLLKRKADAKGLGIVLTEKKKDDLELMITQYEEVGSKAILFVKHADRVLQESIPEKGLPHLVLFFTNENLEFVLDGLCDNPSYKEKVVEVKAPKIMTAPKPVVPELSDEEIRDLLPEGATVAHCKYGKGTITAVLGGKIKVMFEDSAEKVFAGNVCINKKLLTVV